MKSFTREEMRALARENGAPHVTLMMPVHPGGEGGKQDVIRLKNLIHDARKGLSQVDGVDPDAVLAPAIGLLDDAGGWRQPGRGLAMFLANGHSHVWRVPHELPELAFVAESWYLAPLVTAIQDDGEFLVVAVAEDEARLLRCSRHRCARVPLRGATDIGPFRALLEDPDQPHSRQANHFGRGTSTHGHPIGHAQGFGHEDRKKNLWWDYLHGVGHAIRAVTAGQAPPLVFAGTEANLPLFRDAASYPNLMDTGVFGNTTLLSDDELRSRAWDIVAPRFREAGEQAIARFENRLGTERTTTRLRDIVEAARNGRVDLLLFDPQRERFGPLDGDRVLDVHDQPHPGDVALVNEAVVHTLLNGGDVYAPSGGVPGGNGSPVNALLRW